MLFTLIWHYYTRQCERVSWQQYTTHKIVIGNLIRLIAHPIHHWFKNNNILRLLYDITIIVTVCLVKKWLTCKISVLHFYYIFLHFYTFYFYIKNYFAIFFKNNSNLNSDESWIPKHEVLGNYLSKTFNAKRALPETWDPTRTFPRDCKLHGLNIPY